MHLLKQLLNMSVAAEVSLALEFCTAFDSALALYGLIDRPQIVHAVRAVGWAREPWLSVSVRVYARNELYATGSFTSTLTRVPKTWFHRPTSSPGGCRSRGPEYVAPSGSKLMEFVCGIVSVTDRLFGGRSLLMEQVGDLPRPFPRAWTSCRHFREPALPQPVDF